MKAHVFKVVRMRIFYCIPQGLETSEDTEIQTVRKHLYLSVVQEVCLYTTRITNFRGYLNK